MTIFDRQEHLRHIPPIDIFGKRLKEAIKDAHVAEFMMSEDGVAGEASLARYIHGACYPSGVNLLALCQYLNVSADWLLGLSDEKRRLW